jgi:hypothetical protein
MNTNIIMLAALAMNGNCRVNQPSTSQRRLKVAFALCDQPRRIPIKFARTTSASVEASSSKQEVMNLSNVRP